MNFHDFYKKEQNSGRIELCFVLRLGLTISEKKTMFEHHSSQGRICLKRWRRFVGTSLVVRQLLSFDFSTKIAHKYDPHR